MECKRCGKCCVELVDKDFWKQECFPEIVLDPSNEIPLQEKKEKIERLREERKKYPINKKGCEMLIWEGKLAVCLTYKLFGPKARPNSCIKYFCEEVKCQA